VGRRFRLAHLHFSDEIIEVATFRAAAPLDDEASTAADSEDQRPPRHLKSEHGMLLRDNLFGTPAEDALRRDFTINALFYNIADFSIIDYAGGLADLKKGLLRTIGEPRQRIIEDPVRMIRAIRLSATLGIAMDKATWSALLELAPTITRSAPARLYEELLKLLMCGAAKEAWRLMEETGLLATLLPGLMEMGDRNAMAASVEQGLILADRCKAEGAPLDPQLLLVLIFGPYLEQQSMALISQGIALQDAINMEVAGLFDILAKTLRIPNKVALAMRDILAAQHRFRKMPGRNPQGFMARSSFNDALLFLSFKGEKDPELKRIFDWWQNLRSGVDLGATGAPHGKVGRTPRRRRRKRHGPR
jgi:poly(A) polymerase